MLSIFLAQFRMQAIRSRRLMRSVRRLRRASLVVRGVVHQWRGLRGAVDQSRVLRSTHRVRCALFPGADALLEQSEAVVSQEAIAYWTSFARTGNPSAAKYPTSPPWAPFAADDGKRQRLLVREGTKEKTSSAAEDIADYELIRCAFWMSEEVTAETRV